MLLDVAVAIIGVIWSMGDLTRAALETSEALLIAGPLRETTEDVLMIISLVEADKDL